MLDSILRPVAIWKTVRIKASYVVKNFVKSPKTFVRLVFGRFYTVRLIFSWLDRGHERQMTPPNGSQSLFPYLDIYEVVDSLKEDGVFLGLQLPQDILQEILDYTNSNDCYAGGDPSLGFRISEKQELDRTYNQQFYLADYFNVGEQCPAISRLANDSNLRAIADLYVGKQAQHTGSSLTLTFPVEGRPYDAHRQESCNFHYDIDDYASLRFFFYLTDVTPESGPHVCVRGSHKRKSLLHVFNYLSRKQPDEEIFKFYGGDRVVPIHGKAGFGFIEDTFCFHKGTVPKAQPRLMLMLHFAINSYTNGIHSDHRDSRLLKSFRHSDCPSYERSKMPS